MNQQQNAQRPNVILLTDDEHRWDFYNGGVSDDLETPTIDRLKQNGVTFPNAISNCPVCMPTRFTWLTGLYGSQSPAGPRNAKDWPLGHPTLAHALQRAGYSTALIGKLHAYRGYSTKEHSVMKTETHERGFDDVFSSCAAAASVKGSPYYNYLKSRGLDDFITLKKRKKNAHEKLAGDAPSAKAPEDRYDNFICREAIRWLQEDRTSEKPFFLHASFTKPHFPLDPPEPFFSKYNPEDMPPPAGVDDPERIKYWQQKRAVYCGLVEYTDRCMGQLLDVVEEQGLMENTIIIFTSDHGDMMGDHDMYFKLKPYDGSVRTPTVIYDPASQRDGGTVLNDMVEAVDIPATILEACSDEHLQEAMPCSPGRSFLQYVRGDKDAHRQWAYSELGHLCEDGNPWRLARTPEWKYVFAPKGDMLFNMMDDPFETKNLIDDESQLKKINHMRGLILERMGSLPVPPATLECNTDPDDPKSLKTWFYKGIINNA